MKLRSPFKTISSGNSKIFLRPRPKPARIRSKLRTNANAGKLKMKIFLNPFHFLWFLLFHHTVTEGKSGSVDVPKTKQRPESSTLKPKVQPRNWILSSLISFCQMMACKHDFLKVAIFPQAEFNLWPDLKSRRGRRSPRRTSASTPRTMSQSKLSLRRRRSRQRRQQQAI